MHDTAESMSRLVIRMPRVAVCMDSVAVCINQGDLMYQGFGMHGMCVSICNTSMAVGMTMGKYVFFRVI
jgi:hypothetical protein